MNDADLRDLALKYLKATTITYAAWQKVVKAGKYNPKDGSTTNWGKAIATLNLISKTPTGIQAPIPPSSYNLPPGISVDTIEELESELQKRTQNIILSDGEY